MKHQDKKEINFNIISGSTRPNSQSNKVALYIQKTTNNTYPFVNTTLTDLNNDNIPYWDEDLWNDPTSWSDSWSFTSKQLKDSDAFIIVTPEWGGMVPPALKNIFQLCHQNELAHKPALIISVSSGLGGSYPVAELRMSSYKNTKICYIPEHMIIHNAKNVLNNHESSDSKQDAYISKRLIYNVKVLYTYALAFKEMRKDNNLLNTDYQYGM